MWSLVSEALTWKRTFFAKKGPQVATETNKEHGMALIANVAGHKPTSTIAECVGLILTLLSGRPTHTALDNLACV